MDEELHQASYTGYSVALFYNTLLRICSPKIGVLQVSLLLTRKGFEFLLFVTVPAD